MKFTLPFHYLLQRRTGILALRRGLFQPGSHPAAFPISHLLLIVALIASLAAAAEPTQSVQAGAPGGYSEYYIPGATDQIMAILDNNEGSAIGSQLTNTITVSVSAKVKVYYDHWENGYHTGSSFDNWDETYTANKGDVLTFRSTTIPYPRGSSDTALTACSGSSYPSGGTGGATDHCYDGRDRIFVAGGAVSVAQVFWPTSMGTVYANAWEIYPIKPYETTYTIPVGENLFAASGSYYDFDNVYVLAQSLEDNTTIQIDDPNSAGVEVTATLDLGEVTQYYHAHTGTTISGGGKPVQVQFIFGDDHSTGSNTKSYTAVPQSLWSHSYISPVPGISATYTTDLFIYNPNSSDLNIRYQDSGGAGTFSVTAKTTESYFANTGRYVPTNSAVTLDAVDGVSKFWAIGSVNAGGASYNWGFTLIPPDQLTSEYYIAWAPGSENLTTYPTNYSPIFVSPKENNTTIFVDYSPADGNVDDTITLNRTQTHKFYDPDLDNTGTHVWGTGPFAITWGEYPQTPTDSTAQLHGIDAGYTILPLNQEWIDLVVTLDKSSSPSVIPPEIGQTVEYTLQIKTDHYGLNDVYITDKLPTGWAYVNDSTIITLPDGVTTITGSAANPGISGQVLTWDKFPATGYDMIGDQNLKVVYRAQTTVVPSVGFAINQAAVGGEYALNDFSGSDSASVNVSNTIVTGHLYFDSNGNGTQDSGEPDLPDVDVLITPSTGVSFTVVTGPNGDWSTAVPSGSTTVDVQTTDPDFTAAVPSGWTQTEGTDPNTLTVTNGATTDAGNVGYYVATGTISGHVYYDSNNNSTQNAGEPNLSDININIDPAYGANQVVSTNASGDWSATVLPGSVSVDVDETDTDFTSVVPSGFTHTEGSDPTSVTAVSSSNTSAGNDGYYTPTQTISGTIFFDANNNAAYDTGEPYLPSIDVVITPVIGAAFTVTTNASGVWTASVPPGSTRANVDENDLPAGATHTLGDDPTDTLVTSGSPADGGIDGYYVTPGTVTGHVYYDLDNNADQNGSDPDLSAISVIITDVYNVAHTVTTDTDGDWTVSIPPGSASVNIDDTTLPPGVSLTEGSDPTPITAVSASTVDGGTDGYYAIPQTISGTIFFDANNNAAYNTGEPYIPNVDVLITPAYGAAFTVTTNASGVWTASVPPGSTSANIDESDLPAGVTHTVGDDPTVTAVPGGSSADGGTDGYYVAPGTVSGHIYYDLNNNATQDGSDPDLSGISVIITDVYNVTHAATTGANGDWTASVPPGSASVNVDDTSLPPGVAQTEGSDPTPVTVVSSSSVDAGADGYYAAPQTISGTIFFDANNNAAYNTGEPYIPNVDVVITPAYGPAFTVTTNASGVWTASVPPGSTSANVDENDLPAGVTHTVGDDPTVTSVPSGSSADGGADGYYVAPGTVYGHIYYDPNHNGNQDDFDPNLSGVTVIITDVFNIAHTVTTNTDGDWTVSIPPGPASANVDETTLLPGVSQTEGSDPTPVTVVSASTVDGGTDGYYAPNGTISGHIYYDLDGDGIQNGSDPDLGGVHVVLIDSLGKSHTLITASNGNWSISVPPGSASANVNETDLPDGATQTQGTDPTITTVVSGSAVDGGTDGYTNQPGTLTGHLYYDLNNDGTFNTGDLNLAGIDLLITDNFGLPHTGTTDTDGNWTITLTPGYTTVDIDETDPDFSDVIPAGWTQTEGDDPTSVIVDSGASTDGGSDGFFADAQLSATKSDAIVAGDGDSALEPGETLQYTVVITNQGGFAPSVTFTDTLDAHTHLVVGSVTPSGSVVHGNTSGDTSVEVNVGTLAYGASFTITFQATLESPLSPSVTNVSNQGAVSWGGVDPGSIVTNDPDTPAANDATLSPVTNPQVSFQKVVTLDEDLNHDNLINPGERLRYTLTVHNAGPGTASGLSLTDTPDANTTLLNGTVTASTGTVQTGNTSGDSTIVVQVPTLANQATVSISYQVRIHDTIPEGVTELHNQAVVTGVNIQQVESDDPNTSTPNDPTSTYLFSPTAVTLQSFHAERIDSQSVRISWTTAEEIDNYGFTLYRTQTADFAQAVEVAFLPSQQIGGHHGAAYQVIDLVSDDAGGYYWLEDIDTHGLHTRHPLFAHVPNNPGSSLVFLPLVHGGP